MTVTGVWVSDSGGKLVLQRNDVLVLQYLYINILTYSIHKQSVSWGSHLDAPGTESVVFTAERRKKTFACDVPFYEVLLGPAETESQMTCL